MNSPSSTFVKNTHSLFKMGVKEYKLWLKENKPTQDPSMQAPVETDILFDV